VCAHEVPPSRDDVKLGPELSINECGCNILEIGFVTSPSCGAYDDTYRPNNDRKSKKPSKWSVPVSCASYLFVRCDLTTALQ